MHFGSFSMHFLDNRWSLDFILDDFYLFPARDICKSSFTLWSTSTRYDLPYELHSMSLCKNILFAWKSNSCVFCSGMIWSLYFPLKIAIQLINSISFLLMEVLVHHSLGGCSGGGSSHLIRWGVFLRPNEKCGFGIGDLKLYHIRVCERKNISYRYSKKVIQGFSNTGKMSGSWCAF